MTNYFTEDINKAIADAMKLIPAMQEPLRQQENKAIVEERDKVTTVKN